MHNQKCTTELGPSHRNAYKSLSVREREGLRMDMMEEVVFEGRCALRLFRQEEWRQAQPEYSQQEVFTLWPGAAPPSTLVFGTMCSFYDGCPLCSQRGFVLFCVLLGLSRVRWLRLLGVCLYCIIWVNKQLRVSEGAITCRSLSTPEEPSRNISLWLIQRSGILAFFFDLDNRDNYTYQI